MSLPLRQARQSLALPTLTFRRPFGDLKTAATGIKINLHPTEDISNGGPVSLSNQTG
jgi:hypothetical protein